MLVVLGRHIEAFKFIEILLGDEPALSNAENFYQRMLARDPIEAVEQAESFMAKHSHYCDEIVRPALILAQKDIERGILEKTKARALCETVGTLFMDIAYERWVSRKEAHAMTITAAAKLPVLEKDQLALNWRSKEPLLLVRVRSELDEAAATVLATLTEIHGIEGRVERAEALAAPNLPAKRRYRPFFRHFRPCVHRLHYRRRRRHCSKQSARSPLGTCVPGSRRRGPDRCRCGRSSTAGRFAISADRAVFPRVIRHAWRDVLALYGALFHHRR